MQPNVIDDICIYIYIYISFNELSKTLLLLSLCLVAPPTYKFSIDH